MYTLYLIHFPNNKFYVGITKNFRRRMGQHKGLAGKNNKPVYNAILKYGWENIRKVAHITGLSKESAVELEIEFIRFFDSVKNGYNISYGGSLPFEGQSEKMRKIMSDPQIRKERVSALKSNELGRLTSLRSDEFRKSKTGENNVMFGKIPYNAKKVLCHQTSKIYDSASHAAKELKLNQRLINRVVSGERKHTSNFTFERVI